MVEPTGGNFYWPTIVIIDGKDKKVGQLPSGLPTYTWDWKEEFKHLVGNQPTLGVIAQEAMELFPEAVSMHADGYLQVDYSRIR